MRGLIISLTLIGAPACPTPTPAETVDTETDAAPPVLDLEGLESKDYQRLISRYARHTTPKHPV